MPTALNTGRAAALLGSTEPALNDLIRKGRITPPPEVIAGRRIWQAQHVLQAAEILGVLSPELRTHLGLEVSRVG